jgi:amidase
VTLTAGDRSKLATWDAVETRDRVLARDVSAEEVALAAIARAEEVRHLGAIVVTTYERARERARRGDGRAPLSGVPTFVKDLAHIAGVPIAWGSLAAGRYVSTKTDPFVQRFEGAGVVTLGKSATPEIGLTATTEPVGSPPCRNPWDPSRSTGGSSGGAACLVAAGVVPIAHASDGGGSIRIPASACGLVGLKPSRFRLDMKGSNLLPVNVATDGIVTRTVRDTIAFYAALESSKAPKQVAAVGRVAESPGRKLRMGVFVDAPTRTPVSPEVRDAVFSAARACEQLGHDVEEIPCPFEATVIDDFLRYWGFVAWLQIRTARIEMHRGFDASRIEPWTRGLMDRFRRERLVAFAAIRRLRGFGLTYAAVMRRYDVLLSPTLSEAAPLLGYLATDQPFPTKFERVRAYAPFTPICNVSGAPAITLPLGRSASGLPIGVQLAGRHGDDRLLLELARSLETARPWAAIAPREAWLRAA